PPQGRRASILGGVREPFRWGYRPARSPACMSWAECLGHAVFSPLLRDPDSFLRLRYECRGRVLRAIKIGDGPELDGHRRPQSVTQMARGTPQTRTIMAGAAQPSREVG